MKLLISTAIALVAVTSAPAAAQMGYGAQAPQTVPQAPPSQGQPAQAAEGPKITVSSKASKAISDLQAAVKANDTANIPAKVAAAQAVAQTKDDRYAIGILQRQAALTANDNTALAAAVETLANSGFLDATKVSALYLDLGVHQFNAKQYAPAVTAFQKAVSLTPNDPQALELLARGQLGAGQKADAAGTFQRALQAKVAAGQKPDEDTYKAAVQAAYEARSPGAPEIARGWVAAYPSADAWHNAVAIYLNINRPSESIDLLRLGRATNSLQGTSEYHEYAYEAANEANYGEAKAVIAEGISSGKIKADDPVVQEIQGVLKGKTAPTAAELDTAEKGAREPQAFLRVGDRYYGAGNYAKAADLYRQALAKGVDKNLANLRLGEALARSGDKAGATAALNAVSGPQSEVAKYWLVFVQHSA